MTQIGKRGKVKQPEANAPLQATRTARVDALCHSAPPGQTTRSVQTTRHIPTTRRSQSLWRPVATVVLLILASQGCNHPDHQAPTQVPDGVDLTSKKNPRVAIEPIPKQRSPIRPPCAPRLTALVRPADIERTCKRTAPIPFASKSACRYLYPQGTFLIMEHPSYADLRRAFPNAPTMQTPIGWAFSFQARSGAQSIVIRQHDGSALILQGPKHLCSTRQLKLLALQAAKRLAANPGSGR